MGLRLRQGQMWKSGDQWVRIVHLERLEVRYKVYSNSEAGAGRHGRTSKKEFCRMLKGFTLDTEETLDPRSDVPPPSSSG